MAKDLWKRAFFALAIAMPLACVLAAPFFPTWPEKRYLLFYLAPIFSMAPIWIALKIGEHLYPRACAILDALVFLGALGRFVVGLRLWDDYASWGMGAGLGVLAGLLYLRLQGRAGAAAA